MARITASPEIRTTTPVAVKVLDDRSIETTEKKNGRVVAYDSLQVCLRRELKL
jgi:hypothetical protein